MEAQSLLFILIGLIVADFVINTIIDRINLNHQPETMPSELEGIYTPEAFKKAQDYLRDNAKLSMVSSSISLVITVAALATGILGWLNDKLANAIPNPLFQFLFFFAFVFLISDLLSLPVQWYKTFVLEEKYGFNRSTKGLFFKDKLVSYLLTFVIGGLLASSFYQLVKIFQTDFWWYFWLVVIVFLVLTNFLYTSVLLPLFNKLKPLEDGALRTAIFDYAKKVNFPLTNVMVMDGSKRSNKANAFFSGFGSQKKIVLFDTLINNHSTEELVAVLAHETGHFKKKHIIQGLAVAIIQTGVMLFLLSLLLFTPELSKALGSTQHSYALNLVGFAILFTPVSEILGLLLNGWSRKNEFEADRYAAETYGAVPLIDALKKLSEKNLSNPAPHPVYVKFHYSHPPLLDRLKALYSLRG